MKVKTVLETFRSQYPDRKIIQLPEDNPAEILCEIEPTEEHPDYSMAISVLGESVPHKHSKLTEVYMVIKGQLILHIDGKDIPLQQGEAYRIHPGSVHWATAQEAWIRVDSRPGWTIADHIIVDLNAVKEYIRTDGT